MATLPPSTARMLAATLCAVGGLVLTGCGANEAAPDTAGETSTEDQTTQGDQPLREDPPEPYVGPYNAAFANELGTYPETGEIGVYEGMEVTLTAEIGEIVSPIAVAVTAPQDPSVAPLLVVLENGDVTFQPGDPVEVTGTVHAAYNVPDTKENLGDAPEADVLAHYDGQPYIQATSVDGPTPDATTSTG